MLLTLTSKVGKVTVWQLTAGEFALGPTNNFDPNSSPLLLEIQFSDKGKTRASFLSGNVMKILKCVYLPEQIYIML